MPRRGPGPAGAPPSPDSGQRGAPGGPAPCPVPAALPPPPSDQPAAEGRRHGPQGHQISQGEIRDRLPEIEGRQRRGEHHGPQGGGQGRRPESGPAPPAAGAGWSPWAAASTPAASAPGAGLKKAGCPPPMQRRAEVRYGLRKRGSRPAGASRPGRGPSAGPAPAPSRAASCSRISITAARTTEGVQPEMSVKTSTTPQVTRAERRFPPAQQAGDQGGQEGQVHPGHRHRVGQAGSLKGGGVVVGEVVPVPGGQCPDQGRRILWEGGVHPPV